MSSPGAVDEQCGATSRSIDKPRRRDLADLEDLRGQTRASREGPTTACLLGQPVLADHLADAFSAFDLSCEDPEREHLSPGHAPVAARKTTLQGRRHFRGGSTSGETMRGIATAVPGL
jgi:hypothetical protein